MDGLVDLQLGAPQQIVALQTDFFSFRFLINVYSVFRKLSNLPHEGNSVSALRFFFCSWTSGGLWKKASLRQSTGTGLFIDVRGLQH